MDIITEKKDVFIRGEMKMMAFIGLHSLFLRCKSVAKVASKGSQQNVRANSTCPDSKQGYSPGKDPYVNAMKNSSGRKLKNSIVELSVESSQRRTVSFLIEEVPTNEIKLSSSVGTVAVLEPI